MIEIIRPGTKNQVECNYCGALLSYQKEDIQESEQIYAQRVSFSYKYIVCPQCNSEVSLEATR